MRDRGSETRKCAHTDAFQDAGGMLDLSEDILPCYLKDHEQQGYRADAYPQHIILSSKGAEEEATGEDADKGARNETLMLFESKSLL